MAKLIHFTVAPWQHWGLLKPESLALVTEQGKFTWRELCEQINALAGHFSHQEIPKGMPVALLAKSEDHHSVLLSLLAAWQQGVATLLINRAFSQDDIQAILKNTSIQTLIEPQNLSKKLAQKSENRFELDKPLTLTLTSGSMGLPKAVVHNARQHLFSAVGLLSEMPFHAQDCWLLSLPLYHISGLAILWRWLAVGAILKISNCRGAHLLTSLKDTSHASLVPSQLQRILDCKLKTTHHLRCVLLGGTGIAKSLVDSAQRQGIACWCGYGMTEMASTISAKRADHIDSVGKVLPFRKIKLSAKNEILVQGQTLALGYFKHAKLKPIKLGWFATKDVGQWVEKGELRVNGRLDNMFICGGENIQPESIERKLSQFPNIGQIMILPWADEKWGHVPIALVEKEVDHGAFFNFAKANLANYQVPQKIFRIPADLLDSGIKLSRVTLAHWLKKMRLDEE